MCVDELVWHRLVQLPRWRCPKRLNMGTLRAIIGTTHSNLFWISQTPGDRRWKCSEASVSCSSIRKNEQVPQKLPVRRFYPCSRAEKTCEGSGSLQLAKSKNSNDSKYPKFHKKMRYGDFNTQTSSVILSPTTIRNTYDFEIHVDSYDFHLPWKNMIFHYLFN